jgi:uncharacterized protein YigE (DUF2233 family)
LKSGTSNVRNAVLVFVGIVALFLAGALVFGEQGGAAVCKTETFEGDGFTVCTFRPARDEIALVWADAQGQALRSFEAVGASGLFDAKRVRFAMNAGMFDASGAPIGLFVANGQESKALNQQAGPGNFHMEPNGVFFVDAAREPHVVTTADYAAGGAQPVWATQSGPMLVIAGQLNAQFTQDGPSRHVRNGVGVHDGVAYFVISEAAVSFGRFARFFRDALKCEDALYLDGAVSSLWVPSSGRRDDGSLLGPMVVVSERPKLQS